MWHNIETDTIYEKLDTNINGLDDGNIKKRLNKYGKNELPKKSKNSFFKIFIRQIINPIVLLLIFTVIVSIFLHEITDAIVIIFIILIDLFLGTYQEYKAEKTADALSKLLSIDSNVIRNGKEIVIDSKDIVVGDIILFESGDKISADVRIIECNNLLVDESTLTGESIAVEKNNEILDENINLSDRKNMLYAGTSILRGRAKGIVVETGINTEVGKIADDVNKTNNEKSPLTIRIEKFSKQICIITLVIALIITIILVLKGYEASMIFASVIALSVSAMPEGLPLSLTVALTISSLKLSKKNVIVKKLNSVESLGSCTLIASDKTGTLTVNEQTVKIIVMPNNSTTLIEGSGYDDFGTLHYDKNNKENIDKLIMCGYINNEANIIKIKDGYECFGDSIDIAFKFLGKKSKVNTNDIDILSTIPYESENKYSAIFYKINNEIHCTVKGSLEKVMLFSNTMKTDDKNVPIDFELLNNQNEDLASKGYRVIALADGIVSNSNIKKVYDIKDIPKLNFMGLVGFVDPVRLDVKRAINKCKKAGIKIIVITGDHPKTAYTIANELGIVNSYDEVITKEEFDSYQNNNEYEFDEMIKVKKVFARVTPSDKLKIVESCKRSGEFVAVTGDGVNDAPAIKHANIGVSMGNGTDVAKETASMIIMDNSFKSIVLGVEQGRIAYSNIRKVVYMLLSSGFAEILFFLLSLIFNLPMPLIAIQILWLNVVTDGLQDFALSFEEKEDGIMEENPRPPSEALFDKVLFKEVLISGLSMGLIVFILWIYLINFTSISEPLARGYVMALMVFLQNFQVFNCCSEKNSIFKHNFKKNMLVIYSVVFAIILQFMVSEIQILSKFFKIESVPIKDMIMLFLYSTIILLIMEIYKYIVRKRNIKN